MTEATTTQDPVVEAFLAKKPYNPRLHEPARAESLARWTGFVRHYHVIDESWGAYYEELVDINPWDTAPPCPYYWDHQAMYKCRDGKRLWVAQPYQLGRQELDNLPMLRAFAEKHNFNFYISAGASWWFPGSTIAVVVHNTNA